ncbi:MAG TPA: response regulator transcription factor [Polyangiaceae bacterium]|jgi:DNA-binding response OmpR family regulator|nr:response regulator transcription factor [Polyangiaceae bacterium]
MTTRVLVVDDDVRLYELIRSFLEQNDVGPAHAPNGRRALELLEREAFDAVLLDVMMPELDGLSVLKRLRARWPTLPVLMLTAKGDETDRVVGLELGADDYLTKPFSPRELLARLRAVLRRANPDLGRQRLAAGNVVLEVETRAVHVDGQPVELTGLEFDLLLSLLRRAGQVVPRASLLAQAGRTDVTVSDRTVDVHISHLRKKLGDDPPRLIRTVRGVGYVLAKDGA